LVWFCLLSLVVAFF
jgi:hypothetical protein